MAYRIGTGWYPAEPVFHVKGPTVPGALRGMGVLENHLVDTLGLAQKQQRQARNVHDAAVPTGVLKSTDEELDADDAAELKAAWQQSQHTRTVAVINAPPRTSGSRGTRRRPSCSRPASSACTRSR